MDGWTQADEGERILADVHEHGEIKQAVETLAALIYKHPSYKMQPWTVRDGIDELLDEALCRLDPR